MSENKYFNEALASMAAHAAYIDAVRHMYDMGLSADEIHRKLDYPVSVEKIEKAIADYENEKNSPESEYEYVQRTNQYGKRSFIRVRKDTQK